MASGTGCDAAPGLTMGRNLFHRKTRARGAAAPRRTLPHRVHAAHPGALRQAWSRDGGPDRFTARVLSVVRRIPPGRVATYGDVAAMAGRPRAWRAVGNIMRGCSAVGVPCHRVIAAGGRLGGYGGAAGLKRELLRAEGVLVSATRIRDFEIRRWRR